MSFNVFNILDLIEQIGEDEVKNVLSNFSCSKNQEIESYLLKNSIEFSRKKMSMTYLITNDTGMLAGYFTLTHKPTNISGKELLSNTSRKKLERYAKADSETGIYNISAFLIAQIGKNENYQGIDILSGDQLMENCLNVLKNIQHQIGGGIVFLECEDKEKLLAFYGRHGFIQYGERMAENDILYKMLLKFF